MRQIHFRRDLTILVLGCMACTSTALAQVSTTTQSQIQDTGISGLWVLANISFAGMRAQNNRGDFGPSGHTRRQAPTRS